MSKMNPVLYRFVRYCLNRSYASMDFSKLDTDKRYAIDVFVDSIKNSEDSWRKVDDLIAFIRNDLPALYRTALTAVPKDIMTKFVNTIFNNCFELDEVNSNKELSNAMKETLNLLLKMEPSTTEPEPSTY
ncbi:MAG: hypothetical protein ACP5NY_02295 [Thermocladium sp.]|mgnify:CR=1 FL=1